MEKGFRLAEALRININFCLSRLVHQLAIATVSTYFYRIIQISRLSFSGLECGRLITLHAWFMPGLTTGAQIPQQIMFVVLETLPFKISQLLPLRYRNHHFVKRGKRIESSPIQVPKEVSFSRKMNSLRNQNNFHRNQEKPLRNVAWKWRFKLRYSHEIKNSLNSLFGQVRLFHKLSKLCQAQSQKLSANYVQKNTWKYRLETTQRRRLQINKTHNLWKEYYCWSSIKKSLPLKLGLFYQINCTTGPLLISGKLHSAQCS